jgi:putative endonuclease
MYYTYVLKSTVDNEIYIGWSNNLKDRLLEHNKGLVKATKHRVPLNVVYYEACLSKEKTIDRE